MPWAWKLTACCDAGEDGFSPGAYVKTHRNGLMCLLQSDAGPVSVSPSPSRMLSAQLCHGASAHPSVLLSPLAVLAKVKLVGRSKRNFYLLPMNSYLLP